MLDRLASGGLITVFVIMALALGYARVFDAPKRVYLGILAITFLTIAGSQFLPDESIFRRNIAGSFGFFGRILVWLSPVILYALLIRWIRKKTRGPKGS